MIALHAVSTYFAKGQKGKRIKAAEQTFLSGEAAKAAPNESVT